MVNILLISTVFFLVVISNAQLIPQCFCNKIEACKSGNVNAILPCADSCQKYASAIGANYQQLRKCILQKEPQIRQALQCADNSLGETCTKSVPRQVKKRQPETLKLAAMNEINHMLYKAGVSSKVQTLIRQGKKFSACVESCMEKKSGNCAKKLGCGLQLPADNVIVKNTKQCAIKSGLNTQGIQQLCNCAAAAGVKQLNGICSKLVIT